MVMQFPALGSRRAIIDRRAVSDRINALAQEHRGDPMRLRGLIVQELKDALDHGRADVARRLEARPTRGREAVSAFAFAPAVAGKREFTLEQWFSTHPPLEKRLAQLASIARELGQR